MKIVAILQARIGSTRLPGKVLLPLAGKPMLANIMERVQRAEMIDGIAVTYPERDREIRAIATRGDACSAGWNGDEADLIGRYLDIAEGQRADLIVRIPCDNPCVDPDYIDQAVEAYLRDPFVYYSNTTAECDGVRLDGIGAEVMSLSRLRWLDERTRGNPVWREHPHRYFEDCGLLSLPQADYRLDVNTQADYEFIQGIYDHFGHNRFTSSEVLGYLQAVGVTR